MSILSQYCLSTFGLSGNGISQKASKAVSLLGMITSFSSHSVNFDGKVLNFGLYVFGQGWSIFEKDGLWQIQIFIFFFHLEAVQNVPDVRALSYNHARF